jgi:hypothetical protein
MMLDWLIGKLKIRRGAGILWIYTAVNLIANHLQCHRYLVPCRCSSTSKWLIWSYYNHIITIL